MYIQYKSKLGAFKKRHEYKQFHFRHVEAVSGLPAALPFVANRFGSQHFHQTESANPVISGLLRGNRLFGNSQIYQTEPVILVWPLGKVIH